jgi:hypothetical protein
MKIREMQHILIPVALFLVVFGNKEFDTWLFSESRWSKDHLPASTIVVPAERTIRWNSSSVLTDSIYRSLMNKPADNWSQDAKMNLPRAILAQLLASNNIPELNKQILNLKPWGTSGSKWWLNPNGGYDFSAATFTAILYLFDNKPQILYPETKKHLTEVLLIDEGEGFTDAVPGTLGRIKDSENHILMAQGSKYLKNRYRMLHGNNEERFNNELNGMETGILEQLTELSGVGLFEFNSVPYLGYTLAALLNLEAFGSLKVQSAAREVLDYLSFSYALGSYNFKYYPPFRRRYDRAKNTSLSKDYQTVFMKTWLSFHPAIKYTEPIQSGETHALIAACMPYCPADEVVSLIFNKTSGYFVKLGHGSGGSPEIYAAGPGYLLSAGGLNRGKWSNIIARPICLFLNDEADELAEVIHLNGSGKNYMKWNNTGVYKDFACSNGTVSIPEKFKPSAENKLWSVYSLSDTLAVAVHSADGLGIVSVFRNRKATELADELLKYNPDPQNLKRHFRFPGGREIEYDVNAPKHQWVMISVDGKPLDRDFDNWPLIGGDYKR